MQELDLRVNDRIEVIKDDKAYKTLIIDIQDDNLRINLPVVDGEYLMLHTNEVIQINSYLDESRCFNFSSKVISRGREGNIIYYSISAPFDVKKIQRRNFFRVNLLDEVQYKVITDVDKEIIDSIPYHNGLMVDLSGGGLKLKVKEKIKKEDIVLVKIEIKAMTIELKCSVARIEVTQEKEILCGLKFLDITQNQTDLIIEELFTIVRKQRSKM